MKRKRLDTLAWHTTKELIEELIHRTTFVGIVVVSKDENKRPGQKHGLFDTFASMTDSSQVVSVLKKTLTDIEHPSG